MECKALKVYDEQLVYGIRIVPEWNVKVKISDYSIIRVNIRIVPEWNVKVYASSGISTPVSLESYQSGM